MLSDEEMEKNILLHEATLAERVNKYRQSLGLPPLAKIRYMIEWSSGWKPQSGPHRSSFSPLEVTFSNEAIEPPARARFLVHSYWVDACGVIHIEPLSMDEPLALSEIPDRVFEFGAEK